MLGDQHWETKIGAKMIGPEEPLPPPPPILTGTHHPAGSGLVLLNLLVFLFCGGLTCYLSSFLLGSLLLVIFLPFQNII